MKKENKKMAQERRAEERREQKIRTLNNQLLIVCLVILAGVFLATILVQSNEPDRVLSTDSSLEAEDGDTINLDYVGYIDGEEFEGGNTYGLGTDLVLGSGSYIEGFEDQLIGSHPGDTVEVNVTFPEDYGNEEVNGQDAMFEVTINGIYQ